MKKILTFFLAVASVFFFNGCATTEAGGAMAGTAVYSNGELSDALAVSFIDARVATLAGARDLQLTLLSEAKSTAHDSITARTISNIKIDITLIKQSRNTTGIRIRAGDSGDEQLSRELLGKIKEHL